MDTNVNAIVGAFIAVSLLLFVGVQILGGASSGFSCDGLDGFVTGGADDAAKYPTDTWAGTCHEVHGQSQGSFSLLVVVLVVIAAVAVIVVVRMLG